MRMSLYEGLSLVLSTLGTMVTVYLGFRQLRQAAPAAQAMAASYPAPTRGPGLEYGVGPVPGAGATPSTYGVPPAGMEYGRAPAPPSPTFGAPSAGAPPAHGAAPVHGAPPPYSRPPAHGAPPTYGATDPARGLAARQVRPRSVRAASILLFITAALQPLTLLAYYGIEFAINADDAAADLSDAGVTDVTIFGAVAVLCGILGILVARGNRAAAWLVWVFGGLGVPFAALSILGFMLILLDPNEQQGPVGLLLVVVAYLIVVSFALTASAALLINSKARDYFFKKV
jgi:uncharacterized membrane protein